MGNLPMEMAVSGAVNVKLFPGLFPGFALGTPGFWVF